MQTNQVCCSRECAGARLAKRIGPERCRARSLKAGAASAKAAKARRDAKWATYALRHGAEKACALAYLRGYTAGYRHRTYVEFREAAQGRRG